MDQPDELRLGADLTLAHRGLELHADRVRAPREDRGDVLDRVPRDDMARHARLRFGQAIDRLDVCVDLDIEVVRIGDKQQRARASFMTEGIPIVCKGTRRTS